MILQASAHKQDATKILIVQANNEAVVTHSMYGDDERMESALRDSPMLPADPCRRSADDPDL